MAKFTKWFGGLFSNAGGYALGTATADALRPGLQEVVNEAWKAHPSIPLQAQQAANAEIVGFYDAAEVLAEARASGIGATRANALRALAGQAPGFGSLVQMRNRGLIDDKAFERGLGQLGIRDEWRDDVRALRFNLPNANELAEMAAQGVIDYDDAQALALSVGTQATAFDRLYRLAGSPPDVAQLLDLRNRGEIDDATATHGLTQSGLKAEWRERVLGLRRYLLPPSDVIRLAVHEVYDPAKRAALDLDAEFPPEFARRAALLGISEEDARALWAGHWDLPSYSQAAEMLFRTDMEMPEFESLLAALDYAPKWRGRLAEIARRIPTVSDFQRLVRRGVYGGGEREEFQYDAEYPPAFTEKMALHGLSEQDARDLWAGGWRMPSATQLYRMYWREEITEAQLQKGLKALDYPIFWRDRLANVARLVPGRIDIRRMLAAGLKTPAQAEAMYGHLGYSDADAKLMVRLAQATTTSTAKDLTLSQLTAEYEGLYIDRPAYLAQLADLGYSEAEATQLANLADAKRVAKARTQFENRIHTQFVGHKIDRPAADEALTKAGVSASARERILTEWENEKAVNVRDLTQAQVVKAFKKGSLLRPDALDALTDQGLPARKAETLLDSA